MVAPDGVNRAYTNSSRASTSSGSSASVRANWLKNTMLGSAATTNATPGRPAARLAGTTWRASR